MGDLINNLTLYVFIGLIQAKSKEIDYLIFALYNWIREKEGDIVRFLTKEEALAFLTKELEKQGIVGLAHVCTNASKICGTIPNSTRNTLPDDDIWAAAEYLERKMEPSNAKSRNLITLYHGSQYVIKNPEFGKGYFHNDYGQGFYTTRNKGLAGEWAVWVGKKDGYINEYEMDYSNLKVLKLDELPLEIWIATLMTNRKGKYFQETQDIITSFVRKFRVEISEFDVIEGFRADDSYFAYAEQFSLGLLSKENLERAMRFGDLGLQVCLKSKKAFNQIRFIKSYIAPASRFYVSAEIRDNKARMNFRNLKDKRVGTLISDILGRDD